MIRGSSVAESESLGIDFYSGFRKKPQGGVQFEILKNPGIDFYSGFRKKTTRGVQFEIQKKIQVLTFIVASEKMHKGGGGAILIPKKVGPP